MAASAARKELMLKQPEDPLEHMLQCLRTEHPTGPLKVTASHGRGMPGMRDV